MKPLHFSPYIFLLSYCINPIWVPSTKHSAVGRYTLAAFDERWRSNVSFRLSEQFPISAFTGYINLCHLTGEAEDFNSHLTPELLLLSAEIVYVQSIHLVLFNTTCVPPIRLFVDSFISPHSGVRTAQLGVLTMCMIFGAARAFLDFCVGCKYCLICL